MVSQRITLQRKVMYLYDENFNRQPTQPQPLHRSNQRPRSYLNERPMRNVAEQFQWVVICYNINAV